MLTATLENKKVNPVITFLRQLLSIPLHRKDSSLQQEYSKTLLRCAYLVATKIEFVTTYSERFEETEHRLLYLLKHFVGMSYAKKRDKAIHNSFKVIDDDFNRTHAWLSRRDLMSDTLLNNEMRVFVYESKLDIIRMAELLPSVIPRLVHFSQREDPEEFFVRYMFPDGFILDTGKRLTAESKHN